MERESTIGPQWGEGTDVAKYLMKHRTNPPLPTPATKNEVFSLITSAKAEKLHQTIGPVSVKLALILETGRKKKRDWKRVIPSLSKQ